ncbi:HdeD family acid-resistance protein [Streptomyces sp. NBC_00249]|uniref:HdeD family acid-resistance protein n=1 Tax=Streptomyces sp. NBC_00249 TaxID=2975690 RepID=UPI00225BBE7F|nr:HdeD family acid-resistance protein [Streptomyces sp. NBC_00249]MCX5193361.1 HdeD family acid-resistance protein [Streptomyces sp. NBC_00249]
MGTGRTGTEPKQEKKKLSRSFGLLALLGVILVVAGLVGLVYTGLATLTSMFLFGWLLLIGGVVGLAQAVQSRKSNHFWLAVIVAAVNIAAGLVILRRPEASAEALTMFAALLFLTGGLFRLVGALVVRGPNFGLTLVQGAFGVLLGILVLWGWPGSSQYVIGAFFSLALLFDGLSLIVLGMGARRILGLVREDGEDAGAAEGGGAVGTQDAAGKGSAPDQPASGQEASNN